MSIDWANFTPESAAIGGVFIGLAAAILLVFNGRIAGISGIISGILKPMKNEVAWKIAFLFGMLIAPSLFGFFAYMPEVEITSNLPLLIIAGLLVGFGTRLGSGCTSGHGICGMARLSRRSIVAVLIFMVTAFITVAVVNYLGLRG